MGWSDWFKDPSGPGKVKEKSETTKSGTRHEHVLRTSDHARSGSKRDHSHVVVHHKPGGSKSAHSSSKKSSRR